MSEVLTLSVPDTKLSSHTTAEIVDDFIFLLFFAAMWTFESCSQRQSSQGWGLVLLSVSALGLLHGGRGLEVWTTGGGGGQNASGFSVPVVLLLTEIGVAQEGASDETTPAPTAEHEDDNTLGYTGTGAAFPLPPNTEYVLLICDFTWTFVLH